MAERYTIYLCVTVYALCEGKTVTHRTYAVGALSLRQSGTSAFRVCRFLRSASAKNDKHMIIKHHAAAGKRVSVTQNGSTA